MAHSARRGSPPAGYPTLSMHPGSGLEPLGSRTRRSQRGGRSNAERIGHRGRGRKEEEEEGGVLIEPEGATGG